jgi:hypothetical protein
MMMTLSQDTTHPNQDHIVRGLDDQLGELNMGEWSHLSLFQLREEDFHPNTCTDGTGTGIISPISTSGVTHNKRKSRAPYQYDRPVVCQALSAKKPCIISPYSIE